MATFISKYSNLSLVRRAPRLVRDGNGNIIGDEVPEAGDSPWTVDFRGGRYSTEDPVIIDFLRAHKSFNQKEMGFWEQGRAPDEPRPFMQDVMADIAAAAAGRDVDALVATLEAEKETHNRAPIIQQAEASLRAIAEQAEGSEAGSDDNGEVPTVEPVNGVEVGAGEEPESTPQPINAA